eukprot:619267-Hanusia_phi.AAC.1
MDHEEQTGSFHEWFDPRLRPLQMLGGFKTPWGCLLRQPVDGSLVTRMGGESMGVPLSLLSASPDVYQVVKLVGHWTGREDEFKFTAFF